MWCDCTLLVSVIELGIWDAGTDEEEDWFGGLVEEIIDDPRADGESQQYQNLPWVMCHVYMDRCAAHRLGQ